MCTYIPIDCPRAQKHKRHTSWLYIHTYIHTYTHAYIYIHIHTCKGAPQTLWRDAGTKNTVFINIYIHTYIRTYTHRYRGAPATL